MGKDGRTAASLVWAAVPLVTFGLGTVPAFVYPVVRRRKRVDWISLAVYTALMITGFVILDGDDDSVRNDIYFAIFLLVWLGGTVHAFVIRSRVFAATADHVDDAVDDAVAVVEGRKQLRDAARDAAQDPVIAWELRIGRPDLPRKFDDGGLVDINHVPPPVLASLPGMTPELVNRVMLVREQSNGFTSVEELSAFAELPPALTGMLDEYLIFL
jgi:hypothetical protein